MNHHPNNNDNDADDVAAALANIAAFLNDNDEAVVANNNDDDEDHEYDEDDEDADMDAATLVEFLDPEVRDRICQEAMTVLLNRLPFPSRFRDRTSVRFAEHFIHKM